MDRNDQQAIGNLFEKLANVERQTPPRDAEAERFINDQIARQPGAPYYMAQTIVVQEQALNAAQSRIEELEQQAQQSAGGGLLGGLFGGGARRSGSVPWVGRTAAAVPQEPLSGNDRQRAGGGFLAGAAQTVMGVAGGVLLGNAIAGMFGGSEAQATEPAASQPDEAAADPAGDAGSDGGGDFGDIEF
ncbi:DUF2076 domain-containing protein [Mesorhizobium sp. M5C.F.Ca.IN.020.29.1.1]|uniref:DUF2076 domain-containing protein n=2 Tax=unclassified Mesorhizobium TaxID=325217 RepID=UPI000FCA3331|nr:DUF2076 domain-containing protein [Mesorhizobium sp. M5C.F.Ca.IN.020.29.1.1]RUV48448.1 DUF2076 domain-containing protein [Mesorhizobium sp. M5C.F.Ca.IN.020.29.1.1]